MHATRNLQAMKNISEVILHKNDFLYKGVYKGPANFVDNILSRSKGASDVAVFELNIYLKCNLCNVRIFAEKVR